jgi:hypothetical protein
MNLIDKDARGSNRRVAKNHLEFNRQLSSHLEKSLVFFVLGLGDIKVIVAHVDHQSEELPGITLLFCSFHSFDRFGG